MDARPKFDDVKDIPDTNDTFDQIQEKIYPVNNSETSENNHGSSLLKNFNNFDDNAVEDAGEYVSTSWIEKISPFNLYNCITEDENDEESVLDGFSGDFGSRILINEDAFFDLQKDLEDQSCGNLSPETLEIHKSLLTEKFGGVYCHYYLIIRTRIRQTRI